MDEFYMTDKPNCPHCKHVLRDEWEIDFGAGIDGDAVVTCGSCGEEFYCSRMVTFHYSTSKRDNGEGK